MSDATPRLALPFILPGQAQKEVFHNEALTRIDLALHAAVEEGPRASPPGSPATAQVWIVAGGATGDWSGRDGQLAAWTEGGWRYLEPVPGMQVWNKASGLWLHWTENGWSGGELVGASVRVGGVQVVGTRQPGVASPSGGTVIDLEARAAIAAISAVLKSHGLIE